MMPRFLDRLGAGLVKTRDALTRGFREIFSGKVNDQTRERLADMLLAADFGLPLTQRLVASLKEQMDCGQITDDNACKVWLKQEVKVILRDCCKDDGRPTGSAGGLEVVAFFGVNGVGKTTTIGKLACRYVQEGKTVLLAAGDTFRAGAIEQLSIWGKRAGANIVCSVEGADPSAVVFDAIRAAQARRSDYLLIDTAGRLQTNYNLMEELKKITRVISKGLAGACYKRVLVLDAITGQNAVSQAKRFHEAIGITGMALTKLDAAARGGIVVSITEMLRVPVLYAGVGEGVEDLIPFDIEAYVEALFEAS